MKNIKEFINSKELSFNYKTNKLNVVNYDEIILLTDEKIILKKDKKLITIQGLNLTLLKLLDNEILINGSITKIEL